MNVGVKQMYIVSLSLHSCARVWVDGVCMYAFLCAWAGIDASRRRLLTLTTLPGLRADMTEEERMIYMTSLIPMDCINMVSALAVVFAHDTYADQHTVSTMVVIQGSSILVSILCVHGCFSL